MVARIAVSLLLGLFCLGEAGTTAAPPHETCVAFACPPDYHPRDDLANLHCVDVKCDQSDIGTCCLVGKVTPAPTPPPTVTPAPTPPPLTPAPTPPPVTQPVTPPVTPPPTPSPPVVPGNCNVPIPKDGNQPWTVYKKLKVSTPKIDTPPKLLMGGQTLNFTGVLDIRASRFRCQTADHELRAVLNTGQLNNSGVAVMSVHNSLNPAMVTTQCLLTQISLYQSPDTGIPGMRFDYDDCPFGPAKKATLLVGLRKVPNNWGDTPGLANFFKDVCPAAGKTGGDSRLALNLARGMMSGAGCFAESADYSLLTSNCFESAMVFTLMDNNNHFALFPVTDDEWEYLQKHIPKPGPSDCTIPTTPTTTTKIDPCAPVAGVARALDANGVDLCAPKTTPPPQHCDVHVYGHIMQNRLCVAMPELGCHNFCGKVCVPNTPVIGTTTVAPHCLTCYDCEFAEMWYAFWCTILAFFIAHTWHKNMSGGVNCCCCCFWRQTDYNEKYWTNTIQMPELPYSQLTQPRRAISRETFVEASIGFFVLSGIATLIAFAIVNMIDWFVAEHIHGQEMCIKLFAVQNVNAGQGYWWTRNLYTCTNDVCFWRLAGLFMTVWMSLCGLFCYWRFFLQVTVEKEQVTRYEAKVEFGAERGAGVFAYGGTSTVACTVQ